MFCHNITVQYLAPNFKILNLDIDLRDLPNTKYV